MIVDEGDQVDAPQMVRASWIGQPGARTGVALPQRIHPLALEAPVGGGAGTQQAAGLARLAQVRAQRMGVHEYAFALQNLNQHRRRPACFLLAQRDGPREHGRVEGARAVGVAPPAREQTLEAVLAVAFQVAPQAGDGHPRAPGMGDGIRFGRHLAQRLLPLARSGWVMEQSSDQTVPKQSDFDVGVVKRKWIWHSRILRRL